MKKRYWMLAPVLCLWPAVGPAQTMQEILGDGKNTDNVLNHSMGLDRKSYSALKQINKSNIKRLVPIWSTSWVNDWGELSAPTVYGSTTLSVGVWI
jgi:alcohol dehydrogenase (cytochrome c)